MKKNFNSLGTPKDEELLHEKLSLSINNGIIVEIGVLNGFTSNILCTNKNNKVYGIDPLISDSMNVNLIGNKYDIDVVSKNNKNYTFINDYSFNVVKKWNQKIDYIFIDGDHTYEAVKNDFEQWLPFVKKGGYIGLHDSAMFRGGPSFWEGSSKHADELLNDNRVEYLETIFCLTLFKKL